MQCTNCGKENSETSRYCKYCGKPLAVPAAEQTEKSEANSFRIPTGKIKSDTNNKDLQKQTGGSSQLSWVLYLVVAALILIAMFWCRKGVWGTFTIRWSSWDVTRESYTLKGLENWFSSASRIADHYFSAFYSPNKKFMATVEKIHFLFTASDGVQIAGMISYVVGFLWMLVKGRRYQRPSRWFRYLCCLLMMVSVAMTYAATSAWNNMIADFSLEPASAPIRLAILSAAAFLLFVFWDRRQYRPKESMYYFLDTIDSQGYVYNEWMGRGIFEIHSSGQEKETAFALFSLKGKYASFTGTLEAGQGEGEFIACVYADGDRVFCERGRFSSSGEGIPIVVDLKGKNDLRIEVSNLDEAAEGKVYVLGKMA